MQTGKVEVLREDVAKGRVAKEVLDRQQGLLSKMTVHSLLSLPLCLFRLE